MSRDCNLSELDVKQYYVGKRGLIRAPNCDQYFWNMKGMTVEGWLIKTIKTVPQQTNRAICVQTEPMKEII